MKPLLRTLVIAVAAAALSGCGAALQQPISESARATSGRLMLDASAMWRDVREAHEDAARQVEAGAKACKEKADAAKTPLPAWSRETESIVIAACASYGVTIPFRPFLVQDVGDKLVLAKNALASTQELRAVVIRENRQDLTSWIAVLKAVATAADRLVELLGLGSSGGMPFAAVDAKELQRVALEAAAAAEKGELTEKRER